MTVGIYDLSQKIALEARRRRAEFMLGDNIGWLSEMIREAVDPPPITLCVGTFERFEEYAAGRPGYKRIRSMEDARGYDRDTRVLLLDGWRDCRFAEDVMRRYRNHHIID